MKAIKRTLIQKLIPTNFYIRTEGYCPLCEKKSIFIAVEDNLREYHKCISCKSRPRERAVMIKIAEKFPNWRDLSIHESSPGRDGLSVVLKKGCKTYVGSQYFGDENLGAQIKTYRNENLENQTFADESFDIVISQDVMEHVYDYASAFSEIARTLKKGGCHIFSIPYFPDRKTEVWATKGEDGKPIFLKEPEYHGNPISSEGSPVTMHWGVDIAEYIYNSSGMKTEICEVQDSAKGIDSCMHVFISEKQ